MLRKLFDHIVVYRALVARPLRCEGCLEQLILDRSELDAAVNETEANLYIGMTRRTDDAAAQRAYLDFVEQIDPKLKAVGFELDRKIAESPFAPALDPERYGVLLRDLRVEVELFREANVPLQTELARLDQQYSQICGAICSLMFPTRYTPVRNWATKSTSPTICSPRRWKTAASMWSAAPTTSPLRSKRPSGSKAPNWPFCASTTRYPTSVMHADTT